MNIRELVGTRPERRRVGITFPHRHQVMRAAKHIYVDLGVPCDVEDNTISLDLPRTSAHWFQGLLERATGIPGFNEWDQPTNHENRNRT